MKKKTTVKTPVNEAHKRYHDAQANKALDTPAKRLARAAGYETVMCPCGQEFLSAVD